MDEDVDAAETVTNRIGYDRAAFGSCNSRRNEQLGVGKLGRFGSSGREHFHALLAQPYDHRLANSLGAARDERPASLQFEILAHERISSDAILSPSSPKMN